MHAHIFDTHHFAVGVRNLKGVVFAQLQLMGPVEIQSGVFLFDQVPGPVEQCEMPGNVMKGLEVGQLEVSDLMTYEDITTESNSSFWCPCSIVLL